MEEKKQNRNKPEEKKLAEKPKEKVEEKPTEEKDKEVKEKEMKKEETKKEVKKEKAKLVVKKKNEAYIYGKDLRISTKHASAICKAIRDKKVEWCIKFLNEVLHMKKAVPIKGEIPHRKGKHIMSGRYPIKASKQFIKLLRSLVANASVNGLEIEKTIISKAIANKAARPVRRFGRRRFKRTHVFLEAKEKNKINKSKK